MMTSELQCEPEQFELRIIIMSMYTDINWSKDQTEICQANAHRVSDYASRLQRGHWSFLELGFEQNGMGLTSINLTGNGIWSQV